METTFFGENLRVLRENKQLKQHEMLEQIGFPQSTWNNYEKGKSFPNFKDLIKISQYFGVTESDLIHGKIQLVDNSEGNTPAGNQSIASGLSGQKVIPLGKKGVVVPENVPPTVHPTRNFVSFPSKFSTAFGSPDDQTLNETQIQYNLGAPKVITVNERKEENVLYVPVKARAGYLRGYGDADYMVSLPSYRLPGLNNGSYRMFEVDGPSMAPNIMSGDRVVGQWVSNMEEMRDNRVYVIVSRNGVVVKRVINRLKERGKIYLKSDTVAHRHDFPTVELDPSEILEIWYCRLKLSGDFSEPAEVFHRLSDLEAEMTTIRTENNKINDTMQVILSRLNVEKE